MISQYLIWVCIEIGIIFGELNVTFPHVPGRTEEDMFSSTLYRFGLHGSGRWETVQPTGGKPPASAGHSMVFHSPSRTLLVYGGHRPTTARFIPNESLVSLCTSY